MRKSEDKEEDKGVEKVRYPIEQVLSWIIAPPRSKEPAGSPVSME